VNDRANAFNRTLDDCGITYVTNEFLQPMALFVSLWVAPSQKRNVARVVEAQSP
jgi:hypothetical protein